MPDLRKPVSKSKTKQAASAAPKMPEQCARVILHLADGTKVRGIWTGKKWWANRHEVQPVGWEYPPSMIRRQPKLAEKPSGKGLKNAKKTSAAIPIELAAAGCGASK
jgi:hypothetical protein